MIYLITIIVCFMTVVVNLILLGVQFKLYTEFAKERMRGSRD